MPAEVHPFLVMKISARSFRSGRLVSSHPFLLDPVASRNLFSYPFYMAWQQNGV